MARVAWMVTANGYQGHGEWIDANIAALWVKQMNAQYPDIQHWLELKS